MAPQPEVRGLADGVFEHTAIAPGELAFREFCGMVGQGGEEYAVMASFGFVEFYEDRRYVRDPGSPFRSPYEGGGLSEEIQPVGLVGGAGRLVGYQGKQVLGIAVGNDGALHTGGGQKDGARASPEMEEKALENPILQGHVGDYKGIPVEKRKGDVGKLPVEGMPKVQLAFPACVIEIIQQLRIVDGEVFFYKSFAGRKELDGLDKVVYKAAAEFFPDAGDLRFRLFGKGSFQVVPYHLPSVADDMVQQECQGVGQQVEQPHGQ